MEQLIAGGCACGRVRYAARTRPQTAIVCQCRDCQFASGAGHSCHVMLKAGDVSLAGPLTIFRSTADSGNAVERQFCLVCGSPVVYRSAAFASSMFVTAGSLDDPSIFAPAMVVYTASAQPWDRVDPRLTRFDCMPPL